MATWARRSAAEIIEAIKGTGGVKTDIALKLNCNRKTVDVWMAQYPSVKEAYDQEVEAVGDAAEARIFRAIRVEDDLDTAKWFARTKLAHRGYAERKELTGADGAPLVPIVEMVVKEPDGSDGTS